MTKITSLCFVMLIALGVGGQSLRAAAANIRFSSYELAAEQQELLLFDFDGDGLDDMVLLDEPNLAIFFQDARTGFPQAPHLTFSPADKPAVFWPARIGDKPGQSILVMTHDGVSLLTYTGRSTPPERKTIITHPTLIPTETEKPSTIFFTLSARTTGDYPAILIPTVDELEIWQYAGDLGYRHVYSLGNILQTSVSGPWRGNIYSKSYRLNINVGDVNTDGLDDLVICDSIFIKGTISFSIFEQTKAGLFLGQPSAVIESELDDENSWLCLQDVNRDGKVDLIKNTWLREPWLLPGTHSGKVMVCIHLADANGNIPEKPQYVFRKSDWRPAIPIVDIDGDGYIDLVLGYSKINIAEHLLKALTARKLDYNLRFHFYDNGQYPQEPHCQKTLTLHIDRRGPLRGRPNVERWVNLRGDFNGDGCRDLLVRDGAEYFSVYFFRSRKDGFSKKADMRFALAKAKRLLMQDLNRDGVSDLIAVLSAKSLKVFLSRGK